MNALLIGISITVISFFVILFIKYIYQKFHKKIDSSPKELVKKRPDTNNDIFLISIIA